MMARLVIDLLGPPQVRLDGAALPCLAWDKALALLVYLAVEGDRPHTRQKLAGLLWPDSRESLARRNLSQALFELRRDLGEPAGRAPYLLASRESLQFNPAADARLDVAEFRRMAAEALEARDTGGVRLLEEAAELYRGDFLQGFSPANTDIFEQWGVQTREGLHAQALDVLDRLAAFHQAEGNLRRGEEYARRALALEPWHEAGHRTLMAALAASGQRSAALAQYETCRRVLREELGIEPDEETARLAESIRSGERGPMALEPFPGPQPRAAMPTWLTPFIGREREQRELKDLLTSGRARLVTLVGPGGAGKTRLAVQVAEEAADHFAGGAVFVPLAAAATADRLAPAIGAALGVSFEGAADPAARLLAFLNERQMLLTLDNFEQLLSDEGTLPFLLVLLREAPGVRVLVTSRSALGLAGEWLYEVGGLPFDAAGAAAPGESPGQAGLGSDAIRLFVESAQRALGAQAGAGGDLAAVARICRLVDGLPLAIEMAAAWVRLLTPAEIAAEIEQSLDFLAGPSHAGEGRETSGRHRSLRAVFEQSWQLLPADEQQALARLTVFRGGFTRDAAADVAGATLARLSGLVARSLVRRIDAGRYDLHELVRQYAAEHLGEAEAEELGNRHRDYFLALAEAVAAGVRGVERLAWLSRLEVEQDNFRRALEWCADRAVAEPAAAEPGAPAAATEAGLRLAAALWAPWFHEHQATEGHAWLTRMLDLPLAGRPTAARAAALGAAGHAASSAYGDDARGRAWAEESIAIWRRLGDQGPGLATSLLGWSSVLARQGEMERARAAWEESLRLFRQAGDLYGEAEVLLSQGETEKQTANYTRAHHLLEASVALFRRLANLDSLLWTMQELALVALYEGDEQGARSLYRECLATLRGVKDPRDRGSLPLSLARLAYYLDEPGQALAFLEEQLSGMGSYDRVSTAWTINQTGDVLRYMGDDQRAGERYARALALFEALGHRQGAASVYHNLGYLRLHAGDAAGAKRFFADALRIFRSVGHRWSSADAVIGLAGVAVQRGDAARGVCLLAAGMAVQRSIDTSGSLAEPANRQERDRILAAARAGLGEAGFASAWRQGEGLSLGQAVAAALEEDAQEALE